MNHDARLAIGAIEDRLVTVGESDRRHTFSIRTCAPSHNRPRIGVLVLPAMSVPATFYDRVLEEFASLGAAAVSLDWRGVGSSSLRASSAHDWGYRELLCEDIPAAHAAAKGAFDDSISWVVFGHSLGGQLGAIFAAREPDRGLSLVTFAACSVDFRGWSGPSALGILAFTQLARVTSQALGYYPGDRMRFGGRDARGLIADWSHQCRTGRYAARGLDEDLELAMRRYERRALLVSCVGDEWAPSAAVDRLRAKLPRAASERWVYDRQGRSSKSSPSREHFAWARDPRPWASSVIDWMLAP